MTSLKCSLPVFLALNAINSAMANNDEAPVRADAEKPPAINSLSLSVGTSFAAMMAGNQRVARLAQQNSINESQRMIINHLGLSNGQCGTLAVNFSSKAVSLINVENMTGGPALITQTFKIQDGNALKIGNASYQAGDLKISFKAADYSYQVAPSLIDDVLIGAAALKNCPAPRQ